MQEHWLRSDNLYRINELSPDFLSVSVSGMDSGSLLCGRHFGGCAILYRKCFSYCITPLVSCSNRFCANKILDPSGLSFLLACVYIPAEYQSSSFADYLNTLGELEGFLDSHQCDVNILVGDFNVDFDRQSPLTGLLVDFMKSLDFCACDLLYRDLVKFTYERDDGQARSWIDHIICSQSFSSLVSNVNIVNSGSILSDHIPLSFQIQVDCIFTSPSPSSSSTFTHLRVDWSKASSSDLEKFCDLESQNLSPLPSEIISCCSTDCSCHRHLLDDYADHLVHTLLDCSYHSIPTHTSSGSKYLVGWKDGVSKLKEATHFSGIKCGFRQVVLLLVFCLISRKVLKVGISMHITVLCVGNITFCKKNCRTLLLGKVSLISGTILIN